MQNDLISRSALSEMFDERLDKAHLQVATRRTGKTLWSGIYAGTNWGRNVIAEAPAVDAVEVVRCKDCKWLYDGVDMYCCTAHTGLALIKRDGSSFCSYGERRADNGE